MKRASLVLSSLFVLSLAATACGSSDTGMSKEEEFGVALGVTSCLYLEEADTTTADSKLEAALEEAGVGEYYDWTTIQMDDYISGLSAEEKDTVSQAGIDYMKENCDGVAEEFGFTPEDVMDLMLSGDLL